MIKLTAKTRNILISLVVVTFLVAVGVTLAYMFKKTDAVKNEFTPASVSCEIFEVFDGNEKTSITAKNTGNIDAYIRVRLVSYWVDGDGNIVGKASVMPTVAYDGSNWIQGSNSTYYYKSPIGPTQVTAHDLLTAPMVLAADTHYGVPVYQVVEVFAEAIQSNPRSAVADVWNVTVSSTGLIIAAP